MPSATTHAQTWTLAAVLSLGGKLAKAVHTPSKQSISSGLSS